MEIDWTTLTYFVIGAFALNGIFRGWWKEAITAFALAILVGLLQYPDVAEGIIEFVNTTIAAIWDLLSSIVFVEQTSAQAVVATSAADLAPSIPNIEASAPGTWVTILALVVLGTALIGSYGVNRPPTAAGRLLGLIMGSINGFIILGLLREYLDGRALPGSTPASSELTLAGSSAFGPAAPIVSVQATNLPSFTILDSFIPWVTIIAGVFLIFSAFKTRVRVQTDKDKGWKLVWNNLPPFYQKPPPPPKKDGK